MFPYERVVAFLAGPLAALIGIGATALVHQNITHAAAVNAATFILSAGATFLAHHKWLDNVAKWWNHLTASSQTVAALDAGDTRAKPDGPPRA